MAWADDEVIRALQRAPDASALANAELAHVVGVEHIWLTRLQSRPASMPVWPTLTLDECARLARDNARDFSELVDRLTDAELERLVHYRNSAGAEFDGKISDILLQVVLHGSYHRGKIAAALRAAGVEPAPTDYIGFVRGVPAARTPMGSPPSRSMSNVRK